MWVSAKTKSTVFAVIIPFVLGFIPSMLENINNPVINKIIELLPDRLLQISYVIKYFDIYSFGDKVFSAVPTLLILYSLFTVVLVTVVYREYRYKQIG